MSAFTDVDASADPGTCASYLRALTDLPAIDAGKRARDALLGLRPGAAVLDAGCGLGDDIRRLASLVGERGRAVGLDASEALLERAAAIPAAHGVQWIAGDLHALPFADATFDAVRVERTLQHLADPAGAAREILRVLRPGGAACVCEPDWGTLAISTGPVEASERVRDAMLEHVRNGRIGRALARLLVDAGAGGVEVAAETVVFRHTAALPASGIEPTLDPEHLTRITRDAQDGRLVGLLTLVTAVART